MKNKKMCRVVDSVNDKMMEEIKKNLMEKWNKK
jgi:hypothetical protein